MTVSRPASEYLFLMLKLELYATNVTGQNVPGKIYPDKICLDKIYSDTIYLYKIYSDTIYLTKMSRQYISDERR